MRRPAAELVPEIGDKITMSAKHNMETLGAHPKYQKVRLGARQAVRNSTPGVARAWCALVLGLLHIAASIAKVTSDSSICRPVKLMTGLFGHILE